MVPTMRFGGSRWCYCSAKWLTLANVYLIEQCKSSRENVSLHGGWGLSYSGTTKLMLYHCKTFLCNVAHLASDQSHPWTVKLNSPLDCVKIFTCMGVGVFAIQEQPSKCYDCKTFLCILANFTLDQFHPLSVKLRLSKQIWHLFAHKKKILVPRDFDMIC